MKKTIYILVTLILTINLTAKDLRELKKEQDRIGKDNSHEKFSSFVRSDAKSVESIWEKNGVRIADSTQNFANKIKRNNKNSKILAIFSGVAACILFTYLGYKIVGKKNMKHEHSN